MDVLDDSYTPSQSNLKFAPLWRRLIAAIVDLIILIVASYAFLMIGANIFLTLLEDQLRQAQDTSDIERYYITMAIIAASGCVILSFLYFAVSESSWKQGTFGKILVGIRVGKANGEKISFLNSSGRYLAKALSVGIVLIGCIMAAFDPKRRTFHDRLASTYVFGR